MIIKRFIITILIVFLFAETLIAQIPFFIDIYFDHYAPNCSVKSNYDNGIQTIPIEDSVNNRHIKIAGTAYAEVISFTVSVTNNTNNNECSKTFLMTATHSSLHLKINSISAPNLSFNVLKSDNIEEFDFKHTPFFKNMLNYSKTESDKLESTLKAMRLHHFNDNSILKEHFISMMKKRGLYLKKNIQHKYSFWYFRNQIYPSITGLFRKDSAAMSTLQEMYNTVFSKKYNSTIEGKSLRDKIFPYSVLYIGSTLPDFKCKSTDGRIVDNSIFENKIVLLDFWASWCPPCIEKIALIKKIATGLDPSKILIIGINLDYNIETAKKSVSNYDISWVNCFDETHELSNMFSVTAIPVVIVADSNRKIIYNSQINDNEDELIKILKVNLK